VTAHDSTPAPGATRIARRIGAGEVLVVVARGSRPTIQEHMKGHPFAGSVDDERLDRVAASTRLDLALYEGGEGRRLWAFTTALGSFAASSAQRLADWTGAAIEQMPPPGTRRGLEDARAPTFHAPYRGELALRLGAAGIGRPNEAFLFGTRGVYLFTPRLGAGIQLDWQKVFASSSPVGDVTLDLFPLYPVIEMQLPVFMRMVASAGVSGGYALAFLKPQGSDTQILGDWGWAAHAGLRWRSPLRGGGVGLEAMYQHVQPERDGTDPITMAPIRERLDLDGWGLALSLNVWQ